jgi:hypothetical protein
MRLFTLMQTSTRILSSMIRIYLYFTRRQCCGSGMIVTKLSKIWVWDPGSEMWNKHIQDPGSRGQKGTGSRIRNTARRNEFVDQISPDIEIS